MESSRKIQTKVGTLAYFDFFKGMSYLCKNPAMLFHVDMIYLAKQAKYDVKKAYFLRFDKKTEEIPFKIRFVTVLISKQSFYQHCIGPV